MELLFVCEANTCRSAMAEKIAQALAVEGWKMSTRAQRAWRLFPATVQSRKRCAFAARMGWICLSIARRR